MPRDNVAAEPQGAKAGAEQPGTSSAAEVSSAVPQATASELLRHAGVPEEVVNALEAKGEEKAAPAPPVSQTDTVEEASPETETDPAEEEGQEEPEAEAESEGEEKTEDGEIAAQAEESQPEAEVDATDEPEEEQKPSWYQKRLAKWSRQKDRLQDEIDELKEQVARKPESPQPVPQAGPDVFGSIENVNELQRIVELQRGVRDWCMENPDGMVVNEGKPDEKVVTPEEVRKTLIGATRIIEDAPRKALDLQARQQWRTLAQEQWPELFEKNSEVYQTSQAFLREYPAVAQNPNRDFILGLMVEGWKTFKPRMEAKLKGQAAPAANGTNGKLPEALKRKIPPIPKTQAPNPPRGSRVPSPIKNAAAAVERVAQEGASPESVQAAIAAIERQNAASGGAKRTPAPV